MTKNTVPIFFSCDNGYIPMLAVAIKSLENYADKAYDYHIIILHSGSITPDNQVKILNCYGGNCFKIEFKDVSDRIKPLEKELHTRDYYSKSTYFRLFIPSLYPLYDKALYFDSDVLFKNDVSKLFQTELTTEFIGAVPDFAVASCDEFKAYVENKIGVSWRKYFNAGVLVMNLKVLREVCFEEIFVDLLRKVKFTVAQDQDYLNGICKGRVKLINSEWNVMPNVSERFKGEPSLIHYNLDKKPWHYSGIEYESEFWETAKQTEFYQKLLEIRQNYPKEKIQEVKLQTLKLIQTASFESKDEKETARVKQILQEITDKCDKIQG